MESAATVPHTEMPSRRPISWLFFLMLGGGFLLRLRLAGLTFLNPDEALHYLLAHQPSLKLAYDASLTTAHPPLMILFLHYWSLLSRSELFLRIPFVIAGTLFCWIMFLWIRRIANSTAACFGLAMFLFAPALISLSAEIRQYSFLFLFCACCLYWLERGLQTDVANSARWITFSFAALYLALFTHYSAMIFAASIGLYGLLLLIRRTSHKKLRSLWVLGQAGALAICAFLYKTQISKLRSSGIPTEIASTWLRSSILHHGQSFTAFSWNNTLRLFRYFFSQGTIGVFGLALFAFATMVLILSVEKHDPRGRPRELAMLLAVPFLITLALAIVGLYPFGGTRHDALLAIFAICGISIGLDRLPAGSSGTRIRFVKALFLGAALLMCNLFPSPTGPYIRPHNQRRELMHQAIDSIKSLPSGSVLFTDAQGSMVLNYYLCGDAMPLPFTPEESLQTLRCGQYYVITSMAAPTGFDRATFPELLSKARQENSGKGALYLFQSGWIDDREEDWLSKLRGLGGKPRNFGPNILLCPLNR